MKALKHLKTILIHKYWVFYFARKIGIGWQGFWHDMSKLSPTEFFESVKYYTGTRSPIDACKEDKGYSMAWLHHKGRNPSHYEYWQDNFDKGGMPLCMPDKYVKEMFCDYLAADKAYNKNKFTFELEYKWWKKKIENPIAMHPNQKRVIDSMMLFLYTVYKDKDVKDLSKRDWERIKIRLENDLTMWGEKNLSK